MMGGKILLLGPLFLLFNGSTMFIVKKRVPFINLVYYKILEAGHNLS